MRFRLLLIAATICSLQRLPRTAAEIDSVLSCSNRSCVFHDLDPCVDYTVLGAASTTSVELQFLRNLTRCSKDETNEAVTVRASSTDKNQHTTLTNAFCTTVAAFTIDSFCLCVRSMLNPTSGDVVVICTPPPLSDFVPP